MRLTRLTLATVFAVVSGLALPILPASAGEGSQFRFTQSEVSVGEAVGIVTVTVEKIGAGGGGTVTVSTAPASATAPGDYTTVVTVLEFGGGPGTRTADIPIVNDAVVEPSETFTVGLSAPSQGTSLGAPSTLTVTIVDNDASQVQTIHFAASEMTVGEGAGAASITVFRTGPMTSPASASFSVDDGTATAGSDHSGVAGTVSFAVSDGVGSISVPIIQDAVREADETFSLTITSVSPGAVIGTPSVITVTIVDDEPPGPTIGFASSGGSISESGGTAALEIVCGPGTAASTSATIIVSGSADAADADVVGTANCADEGTESVLAIEVNDDAVAEAGETVVVTLSDPTDGAQLVPFAVFTLMIEASDVQPDASIGRELNGSYRGAGVINDSGIGQTSGGRSRYPLEGRTRFIRITQDGPGPVRALLRRNEPANVEVRVFLLLPDGTEREITQETSRGYLLEPATAEVVRLRVTMRFERLLRHGTIRGAIFTLSRITDLLRRDVVRFRLTQG